MGGQDQPALWRAKVAPKGFPSAAADQGDIVWDGLLLDITERKRAEEELREQQQFLRQVIDTDPSLIFVKDWDGRFTLVNKAMADVYGTTPEGLLGKSDADFNANKEEVKYFLQADREVMET